MGHALASSSYNGILPPGFRFNPEDEILVNHYLKLKNSENYSDVDHMIVTIERINNCHPSELKRLCSKPWDDMIYWYFFCKWDRCGKGNRISRKTKTASGIDFGFWKKTGSDKHIMDLETNSVSGKRSILTFNTSCTEIESTDDSGTRYVIHAFEMINPPSTQSEGYVLCRLHENQPTKRKKNKSDTPSNVEITPFNFETPVVSPAVIPSFQGNDEEPEDNSEGQDSNRVDELQVSPEEMMDYEYGHRNFQMIPQGDGHQWRSLSQSPDSSLLGGGNVPEAPPATQGVNHQAKVDPPLQTGFSADHADWESPLQFANRLFNFSDENFGENVGSYGDANHQMTVESPQSPVHQWSGLYPNCS